MTCDMFGLNCGFDLNNIADLRAIWGGGGAEHMGELQGASFKSQRRLVPDWSRPLKTCLAYVIGVSGNVARRPSKVLAGGSRHFPELQNEGNEKSVYMKLTANLADFLQHPNNRIRS